MANSQRRSPRALSEILGELFTVRGYGRLQALSELESAWNAAVGEPYCHETRVGELRRGVLSVTVAHPTLLEELAAFRKAEILEALRASTLGTVVEDIRFRIGAIGQDRAEANKARVARGEQAEAKTKPSSGSRRRARGQLPQLGEQTRGKPGDENAKPDS
jgi:hypothetical protein